MAFGITRRKQRDAFADELGDDAEVKFVDEVVLEEGSGKFAAAHVPDVLALLFAKRFHEELGGRVDDGNARAFAGLEGTRQDVASETVIGELAAAHAQASFVGFAAHERGIDGFEEGGHGVVLGHEEKVDGAVWAGDVAVEGDAEAKYDFAHGGGL